MKKSRKQEQTAEGKSRQKQTPKKSGQKQAGRKSVPQQTPNVPEGRSGSNYPESATVRFGAIIHPPQKADPNWIEKLDIDRVPDPKGQVRALVTPADCVRLLDQGFRVHLESAYPVGPLNPALVESDQSFQRSLEQKLKTIKRPGKGNRS